MIVLLGAISHTPYFTGAVRTVLGGVGWGAYFGGWRVKIWFKG